MGDTCQVKHLVFEFCASGRVVSPINTTLVSLLRLSVAQFTFHLIVQSRAGAPVSDILLSKPAQPIFVYHFDFSFAEVFLAAVHKLFYFPFKSTNCVGREVSSPEAEFRPIKVVDPLLQHVSPLREGSERERCVQFPKQPLVLTSHPNPPQARLVSMVMIVSPCMFLFP